MRIEVTFEIDTDGIVNVTACDRETGQQASTEITLSSGLSEEEIAKILAQRRTDRVQTAKLPGEAPAPSPRPARPEAKRAGAASPAAPRPPAPARPAVAPAPADDDLEVLPDDDDLEAVLEEVAGAAEAAPVVPAAPPVAPAAPPVPVAPAPAPEPPRPSRGPGRGSADAAAPAAAPPAPAPAPAPVRAAAPAPVAEPEGPDLLAGPDLLGGPDDELLGPLDVVADAGDDAPPGSGAPVEFDGALPIGENEIELDPGDLEGLADVDLGSAGDFATGVDGEPMIGGAAEFSEGDFAAPAAVDDEDPNAKTQPDLEGEVPAAAPAPAAGEVDLFGEAGVDLSAFGDDGEEGR